MKKITYSIILLLHLLSSCNNENPLDTEQYKKVVYLIGAADNVVTKKLPYRADSQGTFITVGISGSLLPDRAVTVGLSNHNSIIDWYNKRFKYLPTDIKFRELAPSYYDVPSYAATIQPGDTYARVPINIRTEGLQCDSIYALTFKITSTSDYEVNNVDSALIVTFNLVNDYSGSYIFNGLRHQLNDAGNVVSSTSISNTLRTFKATGEHSVRFYHEQQAETVANIRKYGIVLKLGQSDEVTVSAWEEFELLSAACTYNSAKKVFDISYVYKINETTYRMEGKFTRQAGG